MTKFVTQPKDIAGAQWAAEAVGGETRIPVNMDPDALAVFRFPLRLNHYERKILEMAADLTQRSRQKEARAALRKWCERKILAAGLRLPR